MVASCQYLHVICLSVFWGYRSQKYSVRISSLHWWSEVWIWIQTLPQFHLCSFSAESWRKKMVIYCVTTCTSNSYSGSFSEFISQAKLSYLFAYAETTKHIREWNCCCKCVSYLLAETMCFCSLIQKNTERSENLGKSYKSKLSCVLVAT